MPPASRVGPAHAVVDPEALGRISDPIARNHAITQGYQALSQQMAALLGHELVSWVSFGAWGSARVGQELRREEAPGGLQDVLARAQVQLRALAGLDDLLLSVGLPPVSERISDLEGGAIRTTFEGALAEGNRAIFNALAGPFSRFLQTVHGDGGGDAMERFLAGLPPDEPMLREAFGSHAAALRGPVEEREGLLLLANDQVSLVAQAQLADPIERVLRAPVEEAVRTTLADAVGALGAGSAEAAERLAGVRGSGALDVAIDTAANTYGRLYREATTGVVFRQAIPHETLGGMESAARAALDPVPQHAAHDRFEALVSALRLPSASETRRFSASETMEHLMRRQREGSWFDAPYSQGTSGRSSERATDDWR